MSFNINQIRLGLSDINAWQIAHMNNLNYDNWWQEGMMTNLNQAYYFQKVNQMTSKEALSQRYRAASSKRQYDGMLMGRDLSELLAFMDSHIKKQFESFTLLSFSICGGGDRRFKVDPQFQNAFLTLSIEERITYFELAVNAVPDGDKNTNNSRAQTEESNYDILHIKVIKGLKAGPSYKIKLSSYIIDCTHYQISLKGYLLRRSKKNQQVFILESIIKQDPPTIRFQIVDSSSLKDQALVNCNNRSFTKYITDMTHPQDPFPEEKASRVKLSKDRSPSPIKASSISIDIECKSRISQPVEESVIHDIIHNENGTQDEEIYDLVDRKNEEYQQKKPQPKRKFQKNVAQIILPQLSLVDIENFSDYLPIVQDQQHRLYIYQHTSRKTQFVMQLYLRHEVQAVVRQLCEVQNYKLWNKSINQSHIKLSVSSDNTYLVYMKQRALSQWFRERDFLFLHHLCKVSSAYYFIDCSIENSHFIPFLSIIRGSLRHCITKLEAFSNNQCRLLMKIDIDYEGLLTTEGRQDMTLRFLQEYVGLESFISRFKGEYKCSYDLNWEICLSSEQAQPSNHGDSQSLTSSELFNQPLQRVSATNQDDEFYSIQDDQERQEKIVVHEISKEELALKKRKAAEISYLEEKLEYNQEGLVILPKNYLTVQHEVKPVTIEPRRKKVPYENVMLKNDFKLDKNGGLILVNEPKIAAQDNVIKFMMSTLKKNLFSGKGILNISLPVQIFNCDSNLQRLCESLALAPDLIERNACKASPLERFKQCIAFAFTNSVLYFDIQKAFNPILGETFQGFIDGCPVYGEQISHHPPISSLYFIGRGYKIYGNLEAKVYVHLNSGDGINEGFYTIQFDDGAKIVFQTCPGELSGLAMGDRKFRFKGKTYVVDPKNRLFCAITFEDSSGMFSKNKWVTCDQMQGDIVRVTQSFIRNFFESKEGKDAICPGKKDIEQRLGSLGGRWIDALLIDQKEYYNVKSKPYEMIHYQYPLNSNSNYREDLVYRKLNDLARSQSEKERLEVIQRNDRKLREKYHPKSH